MEVDRKTLIRARRYARNAYNILREADEYRLVHASHAACKALELTAEKFNLGYGVEGYCDELGRAGVQYINAGDSYDVTLCASADRYSARFFLASFAWLAGDRS